MTAVYLSNVMFDLTQFHVIETLLLSSSLSSSSFSTLLLFDRVKGGEMYKLFTSLKNLNNLNILIIVICLNKIAHI